MTVDSENRRSPGKETYLDLVDFALAELDNDDDLQLNDGQVTVINRRKWASNRRVNYEQLERHKKNFLIYYSKFMECIVTMNIEEFHSYTSFIELNRVLENCSETGMRSSSAMYYNTSSTPQFNFSLLNQIKKCIIEVDTFRILNEQKELNWLKLANTLYPVKTIGDGNCLCHACLNYMIGMQDTNLNLRDMLKNYLNSEVGDKIKERWIAQRKTHDAANRILYDDELANREWDEIKSMMTNRKERKEDVKKLDGSEAETTGLTRSKTSITKLPTTTITTQKTAQVISATQKVLITKTTTPTSTSTATSTIQITPNEKLISTVTETQSLMYLEDVHIFALANMLARPIIVISLEMVKDYQSNSMRGIYLPLLVDPSKCIRDPIVIAYHDFHFMPLLYSLDQEKSEPNGRPIKYNHKYFHFENIDQLDELNNDQRLYEKYIKMNSTAMSFSIRNKQSQMYNVLPLVYYNDLRTVMKLHFLSGQENDTQLSLFKKYLTIVEIKVKREELIDDNISPTPGDREVKICCCVLDNSTTRTSKNGINLYLNYLNDTIVKWNNPPSRVSVETQRSKVLECKTYGCTRIPMDDVNKHLGYCYECFTELIKNESTCDEPEKLTQQMELITVNKSRPPTVSNYTDVTSNYKYIGSRLCANSNCSNLIQESTMSGPQGKYCDACIAKLSMPVTSTSLYNKPSGITSINVKLCKCGRELESYRTFCDQCLGLSSLSSTRYGSTGKSNYNNNSTSRTGIIQIPITYETNRTPMSSIDTAPVRGQSSQLYNLRSKLGNFASPTRDASEIGYNASSRPRTSSFYDNHYYQHY